MASVVALALGALASLAIGLGSAWLSVRSPAPVDAISIGAWQAWPNAGTSDVDPYSRARLARTGEIPLGSGEGLVLLAHDDDSGRALASRCDYSIIGQAPPSRLWTLVLETTEGAPIFDRGTPAAIDSEALLRAADGGFTISVSRDPQPGHWISPSDIDRFRIVMRLYDTSARTITGLTTLAMPRIVRERCRG